MNKFFKFFCILVVTFLSTTVSAESKDRPLVVCSTTQLADIARNIAGDDLQIACILKAGVNPHVYQPVPGDSQLVEKSVLCLQNGLHLEGKNWMSTLAKDNGNKPVVTATDGIQPLDLEYEGQIVADPHAWFDPINVAVYTNNITKGFITIDPANKENYTSRARLFLQQIRSLDNWITQQINTIPKARRILITSHDAFNYFAARYGLQVRSPVGWSTGSEIGGGMTPERRRKVIKSIQSYKVPAIFVETSVNPKMIKLIASEAGVEIGGELYSDAMGEENTAGETYIGMMRENVLKIVNALSK